MHSQGTAHRARTAQLIAFCALALVTGCNLRREPPRIQQTPIRAQVENNAVATSLVTTSPETASPIATTSLTTPTTPPPQLPTQKHDAGTGLDGTADRSATTPQPVDLVPEPELDPSMAWIKNVGTPAAGNSRPAPKRSGPPTLRDQQYAGNDTLAVRRLVYRVRFVVPRYFRAGNQTLRPGAAELHIDVGHDRLRARFIGRGWPVHEGSEIRLRSDAPGVYLFDGFGGRSLGPGDMATWFDGRIGAKPKSHVRIHRNYSKASEDDPGPGALMCALLAEWTRQPRENLEGRCRRNATPPGFRLGPWSAELTAILPMRLPRKALRADDRDPPEGLHAQHSGAMLSAVEQHEIEPSTNIKTPENTESSAPPQRNSGLTIRNDADARLIILGSGVPLGWVDAGHRVSFPLRAGSYRVGAMRPLGIVRRRATRTQSPSEIIITAPRGNRLKPLNP